MGPRAAIFVHADVTTMTSYKYLYNNYIEHHGHNYTEAINGPTVWYNECATEWHRLANNMATCTVLEVRGYSYRMHGDHRNIVFEQCNKIHMHPATVLPHQGPAIASTRKKREECTKRKSGR